MDTSAFQKINDLLEKNDKVAIAVGKNPTLDDMAAALSLYLSFKQINKQVTIVSPTNPIVELSNLVGIDKVKSSLEGDSGDLIVSFPYQDRQIEKVSYNLDEEAHQLHIIVKAGEAGLQFDEKDVQFRRSGGLPKLLFILGTQRLTELESLFDANALKETTVVNIDNNQANQRFGEIVMVSPDFSSLSEQIGNLLMVLDLPIDQDTAQNLLAGISQATENFQSPQTSYIAFEIAAMLMRKGAKRTQGYAQARVQQQNRAPFSSPQPQPQPQRQSPAELQQRLSQELKAMQQQRGEPRRAQFPQSRPNQNTMPNSPQQINPIQQPVRGSVQNDQQPEPPSDWLEPKVYKGSTPL